MIDIKASISIPNVLLHIEKAIDDALPHSAFRVAQSVAFKSMQNVGERTMHSSGKLANSIRIKNANSRVGFGRYDIVATVPYAAWVEMGSKTPIGLPYSNSGGKDYSKSKFRGYNYMKDAAEFIVGDEGFAQLVTYPIIKRIINMKGSTIYR